MSKPIFQQKVLWLLAGVVLGYILTRSGLLQPHITVQKDTVGKASQRNEPPWNDITPRTVDPQLSAHQKDLPSTKPAKMNNRPKSDKLQPSPQYNEKHVGSVANIQAIDPSARVNISNTDGVKDNHVKAKQSTFCGVCDILDLKANSTDLSKCVPMSISPRAMICIYPDDQDIHVSRALRLGGMFEGHVVSVFQQALRRDSHLGVLDIGANLGIYSLTAAAMGRQVLSVEPLQSNFKRFHKSIKLNHFENLITVVTNAVSNKREKVYLKLEAGNKGGTTMFRSENACRHGNCPYTNSIYTDDLIPLIQSKNITKAVMKIDIEGAEHLALATASKLFSSIHIPYIFMEALFQKEFCGSGVPYSQDKQLRMDMFSFLKKQGYKVHRSGMNGGELDPRTCSRNWPTDIIWVHHSHSLPP